MITNTDLIATVIALVASCAVMIWQFIYIRKQENTIYVLQTLNKRLMSKK